MEQVTMTRAQRPWTIVGPGGLPASRAEWPDAARHAFFDVLRQLDGWCREHDRPRSTNAAIAEQAVREGW